MTVITAFRAACFLAAGFSFVANAPAEPAPGYDFMARDTKGIEHHAAEKQAKATVWLFIAHDCPVCNSYAPEIARICTSYNPRGVSVNVVYAESDLSTAALTTHAREHGYVGPLFTDPQRRLAQACGITVTPEVVVIEPDGQLVYRGRIDDRYLRIGHERAQVTSHDLRATLDAVLAGKPVPTARTQAVGCYVAPVK